MITDLAFLRIEVAEHFLRQMAEAPWGVIAGGVQRSYTPNTLPRMTEWIRQQQSAQHSAFAALPTAGGSVWHLAVRAPITARPAEMIFPPSLVVAADQLYLVWKLEEPLKLALAKTLSAKLAKEIRGEPAIGEAVPLPGTVNFRVAGARVAMRTPVQMMPVNARAYRIVDGDLAGPSSAAPARAITMRASDVEARPIEWLWPGFMPIGALTLLGGAEGMGKSQLALSMAAIVSTGGAWPTGERAAKASALVFEAEDDLASVVIPRLMAAGADLKRVGAGRLVDLSVGTDALAAEVKRQGDVRLIVLSPIRKFMGSAEDHGNLGVRDVLEPLLAWAERERIAILGIAHPPGAKKNQPAFAGSQAFIEVARAAFSVIADPKDKNPVLKQRRRFLVAAKSNLSSDQGTMGYKIEGVRVGAIDTSRVAWVPVGGKSGQENSRA